jgi:hypothetical protein
MVNAVRVSELLDDHVVLDLECLDRIYLNAYVPNLQVSGQVINFMRDHLRCPIPSPAVMTKIGERFRAAVSAFAESAAIPMIHFKGADRQIDLVRPYWRHATGPGVVAIGVAQEFQRVFTARQRPTRDPSVKLFGFDKADRRVTVYYFYVLDAEFGPGFVKMCSWFPYPAKVWVNGHEWAKRQAAKAGIDFTELANGFATCDDPARYRRSVTSSARPRSSCSSSGGCERSRPLSTTRTGRAVTGGNCPCARSRCPAPSCSTLPDGLGRFSRPPWPTTSTSAVLTRSR